MSIHILFLALGGEYMIRLTIGKEEFVITTSQNGYNIKSLTITNSFDAKQGELNETIYRLIERLEA